MYDFYLTKRVPLPNRSRIRKFLLIMKLTTLILVTVILHVSATAIAQKVTLSERNARLVDVFDDISSQTGYNFAFTTTTVQNTRPVTINVKNEELSDVLAQIFAGQNLDFSIENKSVVVKPKEENFLDNLKKQIKSELAQVTITGKVTDELGNPMPRVTVREKGTNNASVTDQNGSYRLTVTDTKTLVDFSYIGYETQELAARDLPVGSVITLKPQPQNLQEVVVNKGYYDEKRALSTGDVGMVTSKEIEEQPGITDPLLALQGRVAGLDIQQNSGLPGAYSTVYIRGVNSIGNGTAPLYVVDGVPVSSVSLSNSKESNAFGYGGGYQHGPTPNTGSGISPLSGLNPADIENIEVLKDADATAIYGSRGANGVVLITTKKGQAGDTKFNLNASQGIGQVSHFMNMLNTQQYLQMMHEAYNNDGLPFPSIRSNPQDYNYDVNGVWDTTRNTNWQKTLIGGTAQYTHVQGELSGGNTNTQFLIGGGYDRQTTVFPGDFEDRKGSVHLSLTHTSSDQKFHAAFTASYVNDNNVSPTFDLTSDITSPPDTPPLYTADGSINWQLYNGSATWYNPIAATLGTSTSITNNLVSNLDLSYKLLPGLVIKSVFGYTHDEMNANSLGLSTGVAPPYNTDPNNRSSAFSNYTLETWIIEPQLSYTKKIARGTLNVLLGATLQQNTTQYSEQYAYGFSSDALITNPQAASNYSLDGANDVIYRYEALLARVGYTWDDKYLVNLTGNRDGSSRFGPGRQFGNFGAVGAGWVFSKERFIQDSLPWLSFGKLRASYGSTGNDQLGDYQYLSTYNTNSTTYQGTTGLSPHGLTNPYFSWEVVTKLEGGIDLGFLRDRINLSVSYFRDRTGNQLVGYPLPSITGFTSVQYNLPAVIQNTGLEVLLNSTNLKNKDFSWTTSVNFTLPNNKLVSFPGLSGSSYAHLYIAGQSLFIKEIYQNTGVNPQTGVYGYTTQNTNGIPSYPQDIVPSIPITQKFFGGLTNSFTYKGFGLDIFIQFVKQNAYNYFVSSRYGYSPGTDGVNWPTAVLNRWQALDNNTAYGKFSTENAADPNRLYGSSTAAITDASFIRLKNVSLSYKLPQSWEQWAHVQNARIYIQGQNLYTFTHYLGLDPETQGLVLPPLRVIAIGINASF